MHHTVEALGEKPQRQALSLHFLQKSIEADPTNGQSLYFLGRTYASLSKVHDAFVSYRSSVDRSEGNADTWCSIGVLYQQQSQPMDSLQAYICAVELDKNHKPAWQNLGLLYESCNQPQDALKCYLSASNGKGSSPANPNLASRIKVLQSQLSNAPVSSTQRTSSKLPSIEDAWNFPISQEMASRQNAAVQGQTNRVNTASHNHRQLHSGSQQTSSTTPGTLNQVVQGQQQLQVKSAVNPTSTLEQPPIKRVKLSASSSQVNLASNPDSYLKPPFYLNPQQLQLLNYFQQNQASLSSQQRSLFQQLQQQYQHMQQHQQKLLVQNQISPTSTPSSSQTLSTASGTSSEYLSHDSSAMQLQTTSSMLSDGKNADVCTPPITESIPANLHSRTTSKESLLASESCPVTTTVGNPILTKPSQCTSTHIEQCESKPSETHSISSSSQPTVVLHDLCTAISDKDLQILLSQKDIASSVAEDLLMQFSCDKLNQKKCSVEKNTCDSKTGSLSDNALKTSSAYPSSLTKRTNITSELKNDSINEKAAEKEEISKCNSGSSKIKLDSPSSSVLCPSSLSINMSSSQLLAACKGLVKNGVSNTRLSGELCPPPSPPDPPYPPLPKEELLPSTPSVFVETKKEALSPELEEFCLSHPIVVIRNLTNVLKVDLGLFSTKTLVEANPDHTIEVRTQLMQAPDENFDQEKKRQVWRCESHRSHTTIARYAQYQASSFQDSLREEQEKAICGQNTTRESDSDSNSSVSRKKRHNSFFRTIKFGTNVDLSCRKKWRNQLQELQKLPPFFRLCSAANMLSHVGHDILGMNTIQLYMKVPGSRTPGHIENNDFSSVNLNIGPGECVWFGVPQEYWGVMHHMCERNGINFLHGSWWPILEDLYAEHIPVYRFTQRPGDLVFVGPGTVHWVQAVGWCNNVAYNVGPLCAKQYKLAVERYELNKLENYKSIVPMAHLTWNLARNLKLSDQELFEQIKYCLLRTLRQCQMTHDFLKELGKVVKYHGRAKNETSHYCICDVEVFNILFVKEIERKHLVHCLECARKSSSTLENFVILEEYTMEDLMEVYDNFILHPVPHSSSSL